jgi:hypothetical protein
MTDDHADKTQLTTQSIIKITSQSLLQKIETTRRKRLMTNTGVGEFQTEFVGGFGTGRQRCIGGSVQPVQFAVRLFEARAVLGQQQGRVAAQQVGTRWRAW